MLPKMILRGGQEFSSFLRSSVGASKAGNGWGRFAENVLTLAKECMDMYIAEIYTEV